MTSTKAQLDLTGADTDADTLFISYARKDVEFAQRLNTDLQRHGVTTWIDELGIRSGEDWPNRIATAIEGCKAMLVILSPDSMASEWVRRELAFADTKGKRVLPLLHRPCKLPKWFELRFGNVQRADFSRGDYETNLVELLASIRQVLGLTVTTPPPPIVEKPESEPEPEPRPSLALKLSVKPQTVDVGGEARWTVTLRNGGDDDLRQVTVKRGQMLLSEPFELAAGKGRRFTFTTTYETKSKKSEKVTVTSIASNGESVRDEASATVQVRPPDLLTINSPIHLELVRVPAGEFLMGSDKSKDKQAYGDEQPQHRLHVSEFYVGKHPVTNVQYAAFVKATKHERPKHWKSGKVPSGEKNHPVLCVSWYSAVAFCEWLSQETDKNFRLPTEAEWEKAARGTEGWIYPWGDERPTAELCNFDNNVGHTTPVGQYSPQGDSPYGCADMAGNVWEWTRSLLGKGRAKPDFGYPYDPGDGREDLKAASEVRRVLRGGAFFFNLRRVRCASRIYDNPYSRNDSYGFRVVVVASPVPL